jgi:lipopolysaccharide transport system permease protein
VIQPLALTAVLRWFFAAHADRHWRRALSVFAYSALVPDVLCHITGLAIPSLVSNLNLVGKMHFPREICRWPTSARALIFCDGRPGVCWLNADHQIPLTPNVMWVIPLLFIQIILTIGVTLIGAALIVFFRDVRFVVPLLTQIWMYASPVIYPATLVPAQWQTLYFLNPMAGIIAGYRSALVLGETPNLPALLLATIVSAVLLLIGYVTFKRSEPLFADLI